MSEKKYEKATLAAGCFWCLEAVYQKVNGVIKVVSGYSGGKTKDPTYEEVCSDTTGHAEVVQVTFDPEVISYPEILKIFWQLHDPTTLNRQGNDRGSQYRSAIFYHNEEQKEIAGKTKKDLQESHIWPNPIVTEIVPIREFYPAEDYHQDYLNQHPGNTYCQYIVLPKVKKFEKTFQSYLKKDQ